MTPEIIDPTATPRTLSGVDLAATRRAMAVLHSMGYMASEATTAKALRAALTPPRPAA